MWLAGIRKPQQKETFPCRPRRTFPELRWSPPISGDIAGWDETGYIVPREMVFDDRLTWHCFGTYWIIGGKHNSSGICVATGLQAGDEFMEQCAWDGMTPLDAKIVTGKCHTIGGTGRYADIRSATSFETQPSAYKMAAGTNSSVVLSNYEGTYKLP
jgi:hypothetical protein